MCHRQMANDISYIRNFVISYVSGRKNITDKMLCSFVLYLRKIIVIV